jgi:hypothetical protein
MISRDTVWPRASILEATALHDARPAWKLCLTLDSAGGQVLAVESDARAREINHQFLPIHKRRPCDLSLGKAVHKTDAARLRSGLAGACRVWIAGARAEAGP